MQSEFLSSPFSLPIALINLFRNKSRRDISFFYGTFRQERKYFLQSISLYFIWYYFKYNRYSKLTISYFSLRYKFFDQFKVFLKQVCIIIDS